MFKKSLIIAQACCALTIAQDVKLPDQQISKETPKVQLAKESVPTKKITPTAAPSAAPKKSSPTKPAAPKAPVNKQPITPQKKVIKVTEQKIDTQGKKKSQCPPHHRSKPLVVENKPNTAAQKPAEPTLKPIDPNAPIRKVTIKNCLNKAEITYKHWSGKHTPTFKLFVNGKEMNMDQQAAFDIQNDTILVQYDFDFARGYYKDSRKVELSVPQGNSFDLHFSWKAQPNFTISKCN